MQPSTVAQHRRLRSRRASLRATLAEEAGAGLAQAMVGIMVGAIFVAAGTAGAMTLIPARLDHATKAHLEDVAVAQRGELSSNGSYLGGEDLRVSYEDVRVASAGEGSCFTAVGLSRAGTPYVLEGGTSAPTSVRELTSGMTLSCVPSAVGRSLITDLGLTASEAAGLVKAVDRLPAPSKVLLDPHTGTLTFTGVKGAYLFRVERLNPAKATWTSVATVAVGGNGTSTATASYAATVPAADREATLRLVAQQTTKPGPRDSFGTGIRAVASTSGMYSSFDAGLGGGSTDWEAQMDDGSWGPASKAGSVQVVTPGLDADGTRSNTSAGALSVGEHRKVRSPLVDVTQGSDHWALQFDARLSGQASVRIEWVDKNGEQVGVTETYPAKSTRGTWMTPGKAGYTFLYSHVDAKPAAATQARVVLIGSGNTKETAAQFDQVRFFDLGADDPVALGARTLFVKNDLENFAKAAEEFRAAKGVYPHSSLAKTELGGLATTMALPGQVTYKDAPVYTYDYCYDKTNRSAFIIWAFTSPTSGYYVSSRNPQAKEFTFSSPQYDVAAQYDKAGIPVAGASPKSPCYNLPAPSGATISVAVSAGLTGINGGVSGHSPTALANGSDTANWHLWTHTKGYTGRLV